MYCKRPATETVEELLGQDAVKAILIAPSPLHPAPRQPWRASLSIAGIVVALAGVVLPITAGAFIALVLPTTVIALIAGKPWIDQFRDRYMNRHELSCADLARLASNAGQKRNMHSLEELRRQLGKGNTQSLLRVTLRHCKAVGGEGPRLFCCRSWTHPSGQRRSQRMGQNSRANRCRLGKSGSIWCGVIARNQLTAKTLIDEPDEERYQQRAHWIRERAKERGQTTGA